MLGISTGTETILLLETEPGTRRLVSQMLLLAGYTVREAADGAEVARLINDGGHAADLLLADLAAPAMNGGELAQRLYRQYPNLRILLTSDHADDQEVLDVVAAGAHLLPKPFSPGALMTKVRQVLDGPLVYAASHSAAVGGRYTAS
jgi:DNA-binding response OmpR family regulator